MSSGLRQIRTGASSFISLWLREWQVLFRGVTASARPARSAQMIIRPVEGQVTVTLMAQGQELFVECCSLADCGRETLDRFLQKASSEFRRSDVSTVLSVTQAVTGSLVVPQQARPRAGEIVRQHLASKMPVALDELFLGHEIRASAAGKLELRYLAVPKARLSRCLTQLSLLPSDISAVQGAAVANLPPVTVPYGSAPVQHTAWVRRIVGLLAFVSVLAPVAGFGAVAWRQNTVLSELERDLAPLTRQASQSTESLKAIYAIAGDLGRLTELRSAASVVLIWEELARFLPDDTYLTEVEVKGSEVHIAGFSASASDLIQPFEASQHLHGATFTGPVVFDRSQSKERFTLRATIRKPRDLIGEGA
jgi:hypothetical protein